MEKEDLIEYDDLPLAAFLVTSGFQLKGIKDHPQRRGLNIFLFAQDQRIGEIVSLFYTNKAKIEPRSFLLAMRDLKSRGARCGPIIKPRQFSESVLGGAPHEPGIYPIVAQEPR
jgi:hypothetical protein